MFKVCIVGEIMDQTKGYRIFLIIILGVLLSLGIFIGLNIYGDDEESNTVSVVNKENVDVYVEPYKEDGLIEDIEVIYVDIYKDCNHIIQKKYYMYGKTLEDVKIYEEETLDSNGYVLVKSSDGVLMYEKDYYCKCPNHYVLKMDDDKVVIYRYADNNEYVKYKDTGILVESLKPDIKAQLMLGIETETTEELYMIIEDMES